LTDEAIVTAAPDVILLMDRGGNLDPAPVDLSAQPALAATPAAETGRVIRMDGAFLLGFGPRTAEAAKELAAKLHAGAD